MEILPIEFGKSFLPESMIFKNGDAQKEREIVFRIFLIKTKGKYILVDAGCETMPGFKMRDFIGSVKALQNLHINPEEITDVIITHAHHDHIECVKYFKNALIHIEIDEYQSGKEYISENQKVNRFKNMFFVCENVTVIKIGGHTKGSCVVQVKDGRKTYILAGDECYLKECLTSKISTGISFYPKASREFIEKYSATKFEVLLCHDK